MKNTPHRRSTGTKADKDEGYLDNGKPDLSPAAGYVKAEPKQYDDESDEQFAKRVDDWETRKSHAEDIQNAAGITQDTYESRKEALKERYERELKALDATKNK